MFTEGLDHEALRWVRQVTHDEGDSDGFAHRQHRVESSFSYSDQSVEESFGEAMETSIQVEEEEEEADEDDEQEEQEEVSGSSDMNFDAARTGATTFATVPGDDGGGYGGVLGGDEDVLTGGYGGVLGGDEDVLTGGYGGVHEDVHMHTGATTFATIPVEKESFGEAVDSLFRVAEEEEPSVTSDVNFCGVGAGAAAAAAATTTTASSNFETSKISALDSSGGHVAWQAIIAYEACIRLCLHAWSRGCAEAPEFLRDECILLRNSFGLQRLLLQPHGESASKDSHPHDDVDARSGPKSRPNVGKVKVQVRKVKLMMRMPSGCQFPSLAGTVSNVCSVGRRSSNKVWSGWAAVRKIRIIPRQPLRSTPVQGPSFSSQGSNYLNTGAQYMRQVSGLLKAGVNTLRSASLLDSQESYFCVLKLKSSPESEAVRVQPGAGDITVLHPEVAADDLLVEVADCKGSLLGRASAPISAIDDMSDRVRWWPIYNEPDHECVGKIQLFMSYITSSAELAPGKWGAVGETVAYDIVLEVAMKVHQFGRRRLRLYGSWQWLLSEFAIYYGVSDIYTKLRYLACVMDVATPTEDCLSLIYELLVPIVTARDESELNRQEKRIFADVEEQLSQLLSFVFENYKSLDETSSSGLLDFFQPPSAVPASAQRLLPIYKHVLPS